MKTFNYIKLASTISLLTLSVNIAAAQEFQDMSDPLAVYSQAGIGATNSGLNFKFGQAYDTNNESTMAMHVFEVKGLGAEALGLSGNDSFDSFRYRHFNINLENGVGTQVDVNWDFNYQLGSTSYSLIQALPPIGNVQLYPLAGLGLNVADVDSSLIVGEEEGVGSIGYAIPSSFGLLGVYSKIEVTDNIWLNYNPMYTTQLGGAELFNSLYGWQHEIIASYQLDKKSNVRAFWNFGEALDGTDFRIEYNYQF